MTRRTVTTARIREDGEWETASGQVYDEFHIVAWQSLPPVYTGK